jgi:hypothetical protein
MNTVASHALKTSGGMRPQRPATVQMKTNGRLPGASITETTANIRLRTIISMRSQRPAKLVVETNDAMLGAPITETVAIKPHGENHDAIF